MTEENITPIILVVLGAIILAFLSFILGMDKEMQNTLHLHTPQHETILRN